MADDNNGIGPKIPFWRTLLTSDVKPWWAPDAQGFVIAAVVVYVGLALRYRMHHPAEVNDKLLDMMLTILYGTAFVAIINYLVGSSRGSQAKDESQNKVIEKLTSTQPAGPPGPVAPLPSPVVVAWWSVLTPAEQAQITAAAQTDAKVQAFVAAAGAGKAAAADLDYLVGAGLLTKERAAAVAAI